MEGLNEIVHGEHLSQCLEPTKSQRKVATVLGGRGTPLLTSPPSTPTPNTAPHRPPNTAPCHAPRPFSRHGSAPLSLFTPRACHFHGTTFPSGPLGLPGLSVELTPWAWTGPARTTQAVSAGRRQRSPALVRPPLEAVPRPVAAYS